MIRLLCITGSMGPGGAETFMMKVFRKVDRNIIRMDFCVAVDYECLYDREILSAGSCVYHITGKTISPKRYKNDLVDLLKKEQFDIVLRLGDTCFSFYDLWIAKRCGVSKIAFRSCNSNANCSKTQLIIHKMLRGIFSRFIDVKIAPSTEAAKFSFGKRAVQNGNVHILHNGLNLDDFTYSESARNSIRDELGIKDNYVIGHIGRFNTQKNHAFLIEIFAEVKKKNKNAILLLVGTGNLENEIKDKVEQLGLLHSVFFLGVRNDIGNILSAMDVFVFPSLYEGMPNTVIEAQANGLHCIVSDSITKEADITGLVEYMPLNNDATKWAEKVLVQGNEHENTLNKIIENHYDIESVVNEFENLFGVIGA